VTFQTRLVTQENSVRRSSPWVAALHSANMSPSYREGKQPQTNGYGKNLYSLWIQLTSGRVDSIQC